MRACLLVPCYNEEARLDQQAFRTFINSQPDIDILFVNDGSSDSTAQTLKALEGPRMHVFNLPNNQGKAAALRQAMLLTVKEARYNYYGFWDADLSAPLFESMEMLNVFRQKPQLKMIFGSRIMKLGNHIKRQLLRHILGRVFATIVSMMMNISVYDTQCGAKLFRAEVVPALFEKSFLSRWFFDVEILWRFLIQGNSADEAFEMPLEYWVHKAGSKLKPMDFLMTFWDLWRIYQQYSPQETANARANRR